MISLPWYVWVIAGVLFAGKCWRVTFRHEWKECDDRDNEDLVFSLILTTLSFWVRGPFYLIADRFDPKNKHLNPKTVGDILAGTGFSWRERRIQRKRDEITALKKRNAQLERELKLTD